MCAIYIIVEIIHIFNINGNIERRIAPIRVFSLALLITIFIINHSFHQFFLGQVGWGIPTHQTRPKENTNLSLRNQNYLIKYSP